MQAIDVSDGFLSLMDDNGETREDLKVPEGDLGKEIIKKISNGELFMVRVDVKNAQTSPSDLEIHCCRLRLTVILFITLRSPEVVFFL